MARIRYIKPDFFLDDQLAEVSLPARFLFSGLWLIADREGRLEDSPKKIKAQILPYDVVDVEALLLELALKFISRYAVDDKKYIQINNFSKHQRPHPNEPVSTIPPETGKLVTNNCAQLRAVSYKGMGKGIGMGTSDRRTDTISNGFDHFRSLWPVDEGMFEAAEVWDKLKPDLKLQAEISRAVRAQRTAKGWDRPDKVSFIPSAAKWLRTKRWTDKVKDPTEVRDGSIL